MIGIAAVPATALLLVLRRRADLDWGPAVSARDRNPFTPGTPDLLLHQAPGRLVTAIAVGWLFAVTCTVLA